MILVPFFFFYIFFCPIFFYFFLATFSPTSPSPQFFFRHDIHPKWILPFSVVSLSFLSYECFTTKFPVLGLVNRGINSQQRFSVLPVPSLSFLRRNSSNESVLRLVHLGLLQERSIFVERTGAGFSSQRGPFLPLWTTGETRFHRTPRFRSCRRKKSNVRTPPVFFVMNLIWMKIHFLGNCHNALRSSRFWSGLLRCWILTNEGFIPHEYRHGSFVPLGFWSYGILKDGDSFLQEYEHCFRSSRFRSTALRSSRLESFEWRRFISSGIGQCLSVPHGSEAVVHATSRFWILNDGDSFPREYWHSSFRSSRFCSSSSMLLRRFGIVTDGDS